jgi:four helix bundle protein
MKTLKKFEDLRVWQEGMLLVIDMNKKMKDYDKDGVIDHMQQCAFAIPSVIAEGYARYSNDDFIVALRIARSMCAKLIILLHKAYEANFIDMQYQTILTEKVKKISFMLHHLLHDYPEDKKYTILTSSKIKHHRFSGEIKDA